MIWYNVNMKRIAVGLAALTFQCLAWGEVAAPLVKDVVFTSPAGEFAGADAARTVTYPIANKALPKGKPGRLSVRIRARATDDDTELVEFGIRQRDGKTWGSTSVPLSTEWRELVVPLDELDPFTHWHGHPAVAADEHPDPSLFTSIHFCFGRWLCARTVKKSHGFEIAFVRLESLSDGSASGARNHLLREFPRLPGETDDSPRFQRAIGSCAGTVLRVPRGTYELATSLFICNACSLELDKGAVLKAVKPMGVVLDIDARGLRKLRDHGQFVRSGVIDGNGLAAGLRIRCPEHYTLADVQILNGKGYGLRVDGGCELIANNLYFRCYLKGLAGNSAIYVNGGDSHYTDCIMIDYTYGVHQVGGGSNRYTRCHVWGGPVREMLEGSVNFKLAGGASTILRDCYADTGKIGYEIGAWDTRLLGCSYFNNKAFKLDDVTIIRHTNGRLLVADGAFCKNMPRTRVYEGTGEVEWRDMTYSGFSEGDDCPGALRYTRRSGTDQQALKLAD